MLVLLIERPPHAHAIIEKGEAPNLVIYSLPSWDSANNGGVWKLGFGGSRNNPNGLSLTFHSHNEGSWTLSASHFETSPHGNDFFLTTSS